jgi:hypothetical protein
MEYYSTMVMVLLTSNWYIIRNNANQSNGFGTVFVAISGLQNGAPDGLALVNNLGSVIQFLSYEGFFVTTNGPANGMMKH